MAAAGRPVPPMGGTAPERRARCPLRGGQPDGQAPLTFGAGYRTLTGDVSEWHVACHHVNRRLQGLFVAVPTRA
jgi:hypothetical protein